MTEDTGLPGGASSETHVYKAPMAAPRPTSANDGSDELIPTLSELKNAFFSSRARREKQSGGPLLTRELRERRDMEERSKRKTWDVVRVRLKLSGELIIERSFAIDDRLQSVYAWAAESFEPDVGEPGTQWVFCKCIPPGMVAGS